MKTYPHLLPLLVHHTLFTASLSAHDIPPATTLDNRHCDCYLVSGPNPGYFQHYEFYDFRKGPLRQHAETNDAGRHPLLPNNGRKPHFEDGFDEPAEIDNDIKLLFGPDATLFSQTPFAQSWMAQTWLSRATPISPVSHMNSERNVFVARDPSNPAPDSTLLVLRAVRRPNQVSTAELESAANNILYASIRIRLRLFGADLLPQSNSSDAPLLNTTGPPPRGACAGIFTYHSATSESDIEILTSDPQTQVRYANQPDYDPVSDTVIPGASVVANIPTPWTAWGTHRLDWFPTESRWLHDDVLLHSTDYGVPDKSSMLVINLWSDGGLWSGDLGIGQRVFLGVKWIELAYNVSLLDRLDFPVGKPSHGRLRQPSTLASPDVEVGVDDDDEDRGVGDSAVNMAGTPCLRACRVDDLHS